MTQNGHKEIYKTPLIGRIQPMEVFLLVMGIVLLIYGITNHQDGVIFFGLVIIPGVFLLHKVRQKDWAKHWQELEAEQTAQLELEARRKNAAAEARKAATDEK